MGRDMASFLRKIGAGKHMKEKVEKKSTIEVVSEDDAPHPTTEEKCPKCGHMEAQWWTKQTRASDEPETKFMKCTSCRHTWRDAS